MAATSFPAQPSRRLEPIPVAFPSAHGAPAGSVARTPPQITHTLSADMDDGPNGAEPRPSNVSEEVAGSIFDMYHSDSANQRRASWAGQQPNGQHEETLTPHTPAAIITGSLPRPGGHRSAPNGALNRSSGASTSGESDGEGGQSTGGSRSRAVSDSPANGAGPRATAGRGRRDGPGPGGRPSDAGGQSVASFTGSIRGADEGQ